METGMQAYENPDPLTGFTTDPPQRMTPTSTLLPSAPMQAIDRSSGEEAPETTSAARTRKRSSSGTAATNSRWFSEKRNVPS